jgi:hypothetical protein
MKLFATPGEREWLTNSLRGGFEKICFSKPNGFDFATFFSSTQANDRDEHVRVDIDRPATSFVP